TARGRLGRVGAGERPGLAAGGEDRHRRSDQRSVAWPHAEPEHARQPRRDGGARRPALRPPAVDVPALRPRARTALIKWPDQNGLISRPRRPASRPAAPPPPPP